MACAVMQYSYFIAADAAIAANRAALVSMGPSLKSALFHSPKYASLRVQVGLDTCCRMGQFLVQQRPRPVSACAQPIAANNEAKVTRSSFHGSTLRLVMMAAS